MLAMVVTGLVLLFIVFGIIAGATKSIISQPDITIEGSGVLLLNTDDIIHEQGQSNSLAAFSGDAAYTPGLYDVLEALKKSTNDNSIKGMLIKIGDEPNGWATMQQLREALESFKKSGKFIYAYGEVIPQRAYYLASVADSVFLNPAGAMELKGLVSQLTFYKGTLEKLEVEPEIFYAGKFKSATEPFRADKISDANRIQITALQNDIWSEYLTATTKHTKIAIDTIHGLANTGAIQFPEDAVHNKLVERLLYWDEVEQRIKTKIGLKGADKIIYTKIDDYALTTRADRKFHDNRIALVFAEGEISDGTNDGEVAIASDDFAATLKKVRNNDKIKAVVVRVNSPGGSAMASEVILREMQLLKAKKPVIVSMGDVAASGGYYIACQADSIFAMPNTITGSIGVFTMLFNASNLAKNKLGITFDEVKNAPYADFPTVTRPLNADEAKRMQTSVDRIYTIFKDRVAKGRNMTPDMVDSIGQGRVWTGTSALKIGLVDGIGGFQRAIASAAHKANLKEYSISTYPEPIDKFQAVMKMLKGTSSATALKTILEQEMGENYYIIKQIKSLQKMNGHAMMSMPFQLKIN